MTGSQLFFREERALLPGARVYQLGCRHGVSSAACIPGKKPLSDATVLDLVLPGHHLRYGCTCTPRGSAGVLQ